MHPATALVNYAVAVGADALLGSTGGAISRYFIDRATNLLLHPQQALLESLSDSFEAI